MGVFVGTSVCANDVGSAVGADVGTPVGYGVVGNLVGYSVVALRRRLRRPSICDISSIPSVVGSVANAKKRSSTKGVRLMGSHISSTRIFNYSYERGNVSWWRGVVRGSAFCVFEGDISPASF